eukprot:2569403-Ditylum_brightwellii.AAC.1
MKDPAITRFYTAGLGGLYPNRDKKKDQEEEEGCRFAKTLILFQPHTGRTHQLRVAAKSIGLPILGDPYYATSTIKGESNAKRTNGNERTFLHAAALHMNLNGKDISIWSPPSFFQKGESPSENDAEEEGG